jgi:hypothetical protein
MARVLPVLSGTVWALWHVKNPAGSFVGIACLDLPVVLMLYRGVSDKNKILVPACFGT